VQLRRQGLIFCEFRCVKKPAEKPKKEYAKETLLEQLILDGVIQASPITYEDFLPFSAAGIFQSNLKNRAGEDSSLELKPPSSDREGLEKAIQTKLLNADDWYAQAQEQSLEAVCVELGLTREELI
ncbi:hypothetical protein CDV31_014905, partial [Fusarium ambrosium]